MQTDKLHLLLADDDSDDCIFFREALEELPADATLTIVGDGVQLMQLLTGDLEPFPNILYLDLNMPRKNGFECLSEIRHNERFRNLPVVIYSTSLDKRVADRLHEQGADYCIRKPADFQDLKKVILKSLELISASQNERRYKEDFIINSD